MEKPSIVRGYRSPTQTERNLFWCLPRPKPDRYRGGMPLYAEDWLMQLAFNILGVDALPYNKILNVFCGMNAYGVRVDLNPEVKPDYLGDVQELSTFLDHRLRFEIILADPAYSDKENEELYGHKMHLSYKKWTSECAKFLSPGGLLIVYHKNLPPNPDPERFVVVKRVAIANRTGHLLRVAVFFQKKVPEEAN